LALFQGRIHSEVLGMQTTLTVILPEASGMDASSRPYQTLYLLHGLSDDDSIWTRRTSIERYASKYHLAVIMPRVDLSFYTDMAEGERYWTFISEELPRICKSYFPLSAKREDTFVAGLSMGGYGAFKLALRKPEQFGAAASLSGALNVGKNIDEVLGKDERAIKFVKRVFGPEGAKGTDNDLLALLAQAASHKDSLPKLYQCCGTEDFLYQDNLVFRSACEKSGIPLRYEEGPGAHDWAYWDARIQDVLDWLPLEKY